MNSSRGLRKFTMVGLSLTLMGGLLAACSGGSSESEETRVLRIGFVSGSADMESYYRQQYTDTYEMMHQNIEFEIVNAINYDDQRYDQPEPGKPVQQPDPYEKLKEMLTGQNPVDVLVFDYNQLRRLTQDNLLKQLDPLITQDKFDLSDYVPTVIDGIKSAGDGNLFALTPTFGSSALFYNKKIFADKGISPPTDKMEWQDVFNLARQVTGGEGEDRTFGFSFNRWSYDGYSDVQNYSSALQLKMWDDKGEKMLVNSDQWKEVWSTVASLHKDEIVPTQKYIQTLNEKMASEGGAGDPFYGDMFIKGKVAMTIGEYGYINELKRAADNASKIKDFVPVDWDVVTVPVNPNDPETGGSIYLSQLMGINAKAQNDKDAWDFIKFTNSKEWAKLKSRSMYEMVARKEFLKPIGGLQYNMDAFTTLKPLTPSSVDNEKIYREKPGIYEAQNPAYQLFQEVLEGKKEAGEALAEWETQGNAVLEKLKTNPNGEMGGGVGIPRPL
ncbi:ABC transporter substrate-binding protein [Paenibacillus sp. N4]|uniref:ABC transporter substrate-binding protein n=1 Tax=Paenibacillus vietnamensis TaxID=2590547 RepID=UPI001CD0BDD8|nr:ABC transporter substrate-binding protein [Paenibacillus vietnamensis]MCA0753862.1 ABC transporter substrate-binding protein [Paenibacillus vietnamensis]